MKLASSPPPPASALYLLSLSSLRVAAPKGKAGREESVSTHRLSLKRKILRGVYESARQAI